MADNNDAVLAIARRSRVRSYRWKNRGRAPGGYIDGMAVAYAEACRALERGDAVVEAIATSAIGDDARDALAWYASDLSSAGAATNTVSDRLLAVFAILLGLGMRESSGRHCEGRDMSAANVTADTAEAGLFQVSHNSIRADPQLQDLFRHHLGRSDLLDLFDDGVSCSTRSWTDWGTGPGRDFQELTKRNPKFAVLYAGVLLRRLRKAWAPINRREAEVTADAVDFLREIRAAVG